MDFYNKGDASTTLPQLTKMSCQRSVSFGWRRLDILPERGQVTGRRNERRRTAVREVVAEGDERVDLLVRSRVRGWTGRARSWGRVEQD